MDIRNWIRGAAVVMGSVAGVGAQTPAHSVVAEQLVTDLLANSANVNVYDGDGTLTDHIDWVGSPREAVSVCSTFVTMLLKHTYGWTGTQFQAKTGSTSPNAAKYFDAIAASSGFVKLAGIDQMVAGDLIAVKYPAGQQTSGHSMVVEGVSGFQSRVLSNQAFLANGAEPGVAGFFDVTVIDSSASYHGKSDSRYGKPGGIGRGGVFRVYVDSAYQITGYTWSVEKTSVYKKVADGYLVDLGRLTPSAW